MFSFFRELNLTESEGVFESDFYKKLNTFTLSTSQVISPSNLPQWMIMEWGKFEVYWHSRVLYISSHPNPLKLC